MHKFMIKCGIILALIFTLLTGGAWAAPPLPGISPNTKRADGSAAQLGDVISRTLTNWVAAPGLYAADLETRLGGASAGTAAELLRLALAMRTEPITDMGATKTIDYTSTGLKKVGILTQSCAITITPPTGPCTFTLILKQGGTGSYTVTWVDTATILWPGGAPPVLSTAVGSIDKITFEYFGTAGIAGVAAHKYLATYTLDMQVAP